MSNKLYDIRKYIFSLPEKDKFIALKYFKDRGFEPLKELTDSAIIILSKKIHSDVINQTEENFDKLNNLYILQTKVNEYLEYFKTYLDDNNEEKYEEF